MNAKTLTVGAVLLSLSIPFAVHATTYYSKSKANTTVRNSVTWCTDVACTQVADPQPTLADDDGNEYVFLSAGKWSADTVPGKCYFGCDGTTVGTAEQNMDITVNRGVYTFSDLTLMGGQLMMNGKWTFDLNGKIDLPAGRGFKLYGFNSFQGEERCFAIGANAVFTSAADSILTCATHFEKSFDGATATAIPYFEFLGDMTGFKGKVYVTDTSRVYENVWARCKLTSASAFGDATAAAQDAVLLGNNVYLEVGPDVVQSATRGITVDLGAAGRAGVVAESGKSWTLSAPVYGTKGTFVKRGAGTVKFDGSLAMPNIEIKEGKVIFGANATYAAAPQILVKSGARVAFEKPVPGATITYEDTPAVDPLTVAYDAAAKSTTPLAYTAAEVTALRAQVGGPIALTLSDTIALPDSVARRLALMTITDGTFTADDFQNLTPATSWGLPRMSIEVETDGAGVQTVVLVTRPTYKWSGSKSLNTGANWGTDAPDPYLGADYYIYKGGKYQVRTGSGSQVVNFNFTGGSLSLTAVNDEILDYAQNFSFAELRLFAGTKVSSNQNSGYGCRLIGKVDVDSSSTGNSKAVVEMPGSKDCEMRTTLTGTGDLKLLAVPGELPLKMTGTSPDFAGGLFFVQESDGQRTVTAANGLAFGGALTELRTDAVSFVPYGETAKAFTFLATESLTVEAANRGWTVKNTALAAAEGKTLTFKPAKLTVTGTLAKTGAGTLALGCPVEGTSALAVEEGFIQPADATSTAGLALTFSSGAGLRAVAGLAVAPEGLVATALAPAAAGGKIVVVVDLPAATVAARETCTVPVCSVPAGHADLTDVLAVSRLKGYTAVLSSATVGERTVYSVTCAPSGFCILLK